MPSQNKALKGYVKTENMILLVLIAVALGFVGGVVFSVFRSGTNLAVTADGTAQAPVTPQDQQKIAEFVRQTESNPEDVNAWTNLGHIYFDSGQPAKAVTAYEKSLALDPNRPDVWTDLGVMYRRNGDPRKAVECFDRALSLKPNHEIALYNKGIVLLHDLNDVQGALANWEKLVQINPDAHTPSGESLKAVIEQMKKKMSQ